MKCVLHSCRYKEVCPYPDSTFTEVTKYMDIPETLLTDFTPGSTYHIEAGFKINEIFYIHSHFQSNKTFREHKCTFINMNICNIMNHHMIWVNSGN